MVSEHVTRARSTGDYLATLSTRDLHDILRETPSLPLEALLNRGEVRMDLARHRIWHDVYWKGSFAKSHPLGWDERLFTPAPVDGSPYVGGRFWKRFDQLRDGVASGHVVNYNVHLLPGKPVVREVAYPDDRRRYFRAGDRVLLLNYTNHPYRIVYDTIKIVAPDACIGVMHLGTFPRGIVFGTFLMSRQNYPFEHMNVPDHDRLFDGAETRVPDAGEIAGRWRGRVVFVRRPDRVMHNQINPGVVSLEVTPSARPAARLRLWLSVNRGDLIAAPASLQLGSGSTVDELRLLGADTLIGRRRRAGSSATPWRYVLRRITPAGR